MHFFEQWAIPPNEGQLHLLRYLLVLASLLHFPYVGMLIGAALFSLGFNLRDRDVANPTFARLAKDLMEVVMPNRAVPFALGVLPLVALWMMYGQWLYGSAATTVNLFGVGAVIVALSLLPLYAYRKTLRPEGRNRGGNLVLGVSGLGTLLLGAFVVACSIVRFHDPERWHLAQNPLRLMLSFNVIWKYAYFLVSGVALTGCAMLFFFFNWSSRKVEEGAYGRFVKNFGAGVALACTLAIPVIGLLYMVTTPILAMSGWVFVLLTATVVLLFLEFTFLYWTVLDEKPRFGTHVFVLFVLFFGLVSVIDQKTLVNATQEHSAALVAQAQEREAKIALEREAEMSANLVVDVKRGEEIFNTVCMTCHRLNERLVGPPLSTVLPKYSGNVDGLAAFIQSPQKINPEYPPMPAPGLSLQDTKSVATYVLGLQSGQGTEAEGGQPPAEEPPADGPQ